ncbi:MAG: spore maturation protein [Eubacteriales bacterium]
MMYVSLLFVPAFIVGVVTYGLLNKTPVYEAFVEGAADGVKMAIKIIPYVVAFVFAVSMFNAAGGFEYLAAVLSPVLSVFNIPPELLPLAITRPFSGNASFGILANILSTYGADSMVGRMASTLMGSSETLFYTIAVYFGNAGITKTKYIVPAALAAEVAGLISTVIICSVVFK